MDYGRLAGFWLLAGCGLTAGAAQAADAIVHSDTFEAGDATSYLPGFGTMEIVGPVGAFASRSLAFNSADNGPGFGYDQIWYQTAATGYAARSVTVAFDLLTTDLIGSNNHFVILFDAPSVRNLIFSGTGNIDVYNIGPGPSGTVGTFSDGVPSHVDMKFDTAADRWDVRVDGKLLYSDAIGAFGVTSLRFSHGAVSGNADLLASCYLDNVLIEATDFIELPTVPPVPLPSTLWLALSGVATLGLYVRHRPAVRRIGSSMPA